VDGKAVKGVDEVGGGEIAGRWRLNEERSAEVVAAGGGVESFRPS
jgi:hypothetical protein